MATSSLIVHFAFTLPAILSMAASVFTDWWPLLALVFSVSLLFAFIETLVSAAHPDTNNKQ